MEDDRPGLSPSELRTLFLFESLDDDQLAWLSEHGRCETRPGGEDGLRRGGAGDLLLRAAVRHHLDAPAGGGHRRRDRAHQPARACTPARPSRSCRTRASEPYATSVLAVTDSDFWVIGAVEFGDKIREWFPMAMHMLEGMTVGFRASQAIVGQRERLLSLGRLSAGLTHELNNPAAAAVRATATLRERVSKMRGKLAHLATADVDPKALVALTELQEAAVEKMAKAEKLSPMQVSEAEDELSDWLDDHGVADGWDLAPALVAAGVNTDWLDEWPTRCRRSSCPTGSTGSRTRWRPSS